MSLYSAAVMLRVVVGKSEVQIRWAAVGLLALALAGCNAPLPEVSITASPPADTTGPPTSTTPPTDPPPLTATPRPTAVPDELVWFGFEYGIHRLH